jgi:hypothetical protein
VNDRKVLKVYTCNILGRISFFIKKILVFSKNKYTYASVTVWTPGGSSVKGFVPKVRYYILHLIIMSKVYFIARRYITPGLTL